MKIRLATPNDAEIISTLNANVQRIHAAALPYLFKPPSSDVFPPSQILEWLADPNTFIFLGELDGQAIGYIYAEIWDQLETSWRYAARSLYIHHITIKPEYQSMGFGTKLMDAVKNLAREKGISTIALDVWSFNAKAHAFFASQGFSNYNERMWLKID